MPNVQVKVTNSLGAASAASSSFVISTSGLSPDGTVLLGGTVGSLVTSMGTWTFGALKSPGNWIILLNGKDTAGVGSRLQVANGGKLYAVGVGGNWYVATGPTQWANTTDPNIPPPPPPPPPAPGEATRVELVFADASTVVLDRAAAGDLGDYNGAFVHQHNYTVRQGKWLVSFRPDADGKRDEVVVEYGIWPKPADTIPVHILAPFKAVISSAAGVITTVNVPKQFWYTRWRWQSAPRPIVRTAADLVGMKAILPMSNAGIYGNKPDYSLSTAVWTGPMGTGGLQTYIGGVGGRQEIGPITELQGSYLIRGNAAARDGMMAQAEVGGSFPFWIRDTGTGTFLDVFKYPYQRIGVTIPTPANPNDPTFFLLDTAHFPSVAFVPYMLTDDPWHLETVQATATMAVILENYHQSLLKLPGMVGPSQVRAIAWDLRAIMRAAAFSPETPPSWLQPKSYFRKMGRDNIAYQKILAASLVPTNGTFHGASPNNHDLPIWQHAFIANVVGWIKYSGFFPEWDESVAWFAEPIMQVTSDPALGGWDRRYPAAYFLPVANALAMTKFFNDGIGSYNPQFPIMEKDVTKMPLATTPKNWGELFTNYKRLMLSSNGVTITVGPEDRLYYTGVDNPGATTGPDYLGLVAGGIAALAHAGLPGAVERDAWMRSKLPAAYAAWKASSDFRYGYAPINVVP